MCWPSGAGRSCSTQRDKDDAVAANGRSVAELGPRLCDKLFWLPDAG